MRDSCVPPFSGPTDNLLTMASGKLVESALQIVSVGLELVVEVAPKLLQAQTKLVDSVSEGLFIGIHHPNADMDCGIQPTSEVSLIPQEDVGALERWLTSCDEQLAFVSSVL